MVERGLAGNLRGDIWDEKRPTRERMRGRATVMMNNAVSRKRPLYNHDRRFPAATASVTMLL